VLFLSLLLVVFNNHRTIGNTLLEKTEIELPTNDPESHANVGTAQTTGSWGTDVNQCKEL
jgi:hypothetical protein